MTEQEQKGNKPDYVGNGVAAWMNEKDGRHYLAIKLFDNLTIYANKYEPKDNTPTR